MSIRNCWTETGSAATSSVSLLISHSRESWIDVYFLPSFPAPMGVQLACTAFLAQFSLTKYLILLLYIHIYTPSCKRFKLLLTKEYGLHHCIAVFSSILDFCAHCVTQELKHLPESPAIPINFLVNWKWEWKNIFSEGDTLEEGFWPFHLVIHFVTFFE